MDDRPVNSIALVHEPVKQNLRSVHAGVNVRPGCAPAVVADLREFRRDFCGRCWILHSREPLCTMGLLEDGGEGGSRTHEPGFTRLPAFEAGSFDHSDTSPRWLNHSNGGAPAGQRWSRYAKNSHGAAANIKLRAGRIF